MPLIITADMHIRDTVPQCRTDDFLAAQWHKVEQIDQLVHKNNAIWLDCGDLFHKAVPPLRLVTEFIHHVDVQIRGVVAGNHDLPAHNMGRIHESGIGLLLAAGKIKYLLDNETLEIDVDGMKCHVYGASYEQAIPKPQFYANNLTNILIYHGMVYRSKQDIIADAPGYTAKQLVKAAPDYDYIICGHNHQQFHMKVGDTMVVNVGCLTRQSAELTNFYHPRVLWLSRSEIKNKEVDFVTLRHATGVVTRDHIDRIQQKEEELSSFVQQLQNKYDFTLSFEQNVEKILREVEADELTIQKVREAVHDNQ